MSDRTMPLTGSARTEPGGRPRIDRLRPLDAAGDPLDHGQSPWDDEASDDKHGFRRPARVWGTPPPGNNPLVIDVEDLRERLLLYAQIRTAPPIEFAEDVDADAWYIERARRLGQTLTREDVIGYQQAWNATPTRCHGGRFRADLPNGLCMACLRDGKPFSDHDAHALAEHLWAIGNPTRASLAATVADRLLERPVGEGFRRLAIRLLARV